MVSATGRGGPAPWLGSRPATQAAGNDGAVPALKVGEDAGDVKRDDDGDGYRSGMGHVFTQQDDRIMHGK